jgi:hypothetical protein
MSFTVAYDFPARQAFYRVPWPASAAVDAVVLRFAAERAPSLESRSYTIRGAGYWIRVRVNREMGTVLVLWLERTR